MADEILMQNCVFYSSAENIIRSSNRAKLKLRLRTIESNMVLPNGSSKKLSLIPGLTGLRGFAAILVTFSHYGGSGGTLGQLGVQIFFALSAFLMCLLYLENSCGKDFKDRGKFAARFLQNRLARKY